MSNTIITERPTTAAAQPAPLSGFISRHPLLSYFALTFVISWGAALLVVGGPGGIPATPEQAARLFAITGLAMIAGPSVAGLLLTGLVAGKAGYRDLLARLLRWRVGAGWYAVALLATPLLMAAVLLALSLFSPEFLPGIVASEDKVSLLLLSSAVALGAGVFEELGWTGFAIPRLRLRYGVLATGLLLGLLWGAWHFFIAFLASGDSAGAFSLALFVPQFLTYVGLFPAYRALMVWVYEHTGSLLLAMLMHASFTASSAILRPLALSAVPTLAYVFVLAAALWAIVAAVAVRTGGRSAGRSVRPRAA